MWDGIVANLYFIYRSQITDYDNIYVAEQLSEIPIIHARSPELSKYNLEPFIYFSPTTGILSSPGNH